MAKKQTRKSVSLNGDKFREFEAAAKASGMSLSQWMTIAGDARLIFDRHQAKPQDSHDEQMAAGHG